MRLSQITVTFFIVALERTDVWWSEGLNIIQEIGRRIREVTDEKRATKFRIQQLGVTLQTGNVISILGSLPPEKELEELYNL